MAEHKDKFSKFPNLYMKLLAKHNNIVISTRNMIGITYEKFSNGYLSLINKCENIDNIVVYIYYDILHKRVIATETITKVVLSNQSLEEYYTSITLFCDDYDIKNNDKEEWLTLTE